MSELPYMPVNVNDAIAESVELTNEELGAFTRISWALWKAGGFLPDDGKKLARIARAGSRWGKIAPAVLALLTIEGGRVSSSNLLAPLLITRERRAAKVKAVNVRYRKPDMPLNSSNPLISNETGGRSVGVMHLQSKTESKYIVEESLRSGAAAASCESAGLAKEASSKSPRSVEAPRKETLHVHGIELLLTRCPRLTRLQAERYVKRWLGRIEGGELQRVLSEAEHHNLRDDPFIRVVEKAVVELERQTLFGGALPFGPTRGGHA